MKMDANELKYEQMESSIDSFKKAEIEASMITALNNKQQVLTVVPIDKDAPSPHT